MAGSNLRDALVEEEWADPEAQVAATATIVFDHHTPALTAKLTGVQHQFLAFHSDRAMRKTGFSRRPELAATC